MLGGGPFLFREVEEGQGPEELRCSDRVQPEVQGSEVGWMVRALEDVLDGVVLPPAARADSTLRQAHPMPVVLKGRTKTRSQLGEGSPRFPRQLLLFRIDFWGWYAKDSIYPSGFNGTSHRGCVDLSPSRLGPGP